MGQKGLAARGPWSRVSPDVERSIDVDRLDPKTLLEGLQATTLAARLRPLWPVIEERLAAGVSHEAVVAALNEAGMAVTLGTFRKNLYRTRKGQTDRQSERKASSPSDSRGESSGDDKLPAQPAEVVFGELPDDFLTNEAARDRYAEQYLANVSRKRLGLRGREK